MTSKNILHFLDKMEGYLSQALLLFFVTLVFIQVILRNFFSIGIPWSEELSRFTFVWFVFFGASYAARLSAHNRVVIQFKLFPPIVGKISMFITDILWVFFNLMMVYQSWIIIEDLLEYPAFSPAMGIPMQYIYAILPISFALMTFRVIQVNYIKYVLKQEIKDVDKIEAEAFEDLVERDFSRSNTKESTKV